MADELQVDSSLSIPLAEIELRTSRSSGPGGQHANVTASRVEAVFDVGRSAALDEAQRARLLERAGPVITAAAGQPGRAPARAAAGWSKSAAPANASAAAAGPRARTER